MDYNRHVRDYRRIRTREIGHSAVRDFAHSWWTLALKQYLAASEGRSVEGFFRWYRKVFEVTPHPPEWVKMVLRDSPTMRIRPEK